MFLNITSIYNIHVVSFKHLISIITHLLVICAGTVAILWFINEKDYEPFITFILILAAILGIFVERWAALKEKRKELLHALAHELYKNMSIVNDSKFNSNSTNVEKFVVFPRLTNFVVETSIVSGAFISEKDRDFFKLLYSWHEHSTEFNNRLDLTEIAMMLDPSPSNIKAWRSRLNEGVTLSIVRKSLGEIVAHLLNNYKSESGVDEDTVLFK